MLHSNLTDKQKKEIERKITRAPTKIKADMIRELKHLHNQIDNIKCFERLCVYLFYKNDVKIYRNSRVRRFFHSKSLSIPEMSIKSKTPADGIIIFYNRCDTNYNRKSFKVYPE